MNKACSTAAWEWSVWKLQLSCGPSSLLHSHITLPVWPHSVSWLHPEIQISKSNFVLAISIGMANKHLPLTMVKTELLILCTSLSVFSIMIKDITSHQLFRLKSRQCNKVVWSTDSEARLHGWIQILPLLLNTWAKIL